MSLKLIAVNWSYLWMNEAINVIVLIVLIGSIESVKSVGLVDSIIYLASIDVHRMY